MFNEIYINEEMLPKYKYMICKQIFRYTFKWSISSIFNNQI